MGFCEHIGPQGNNYAMGSETELIQRLRARGESIVYVPSAIVRHIVREHQIKLRWLLHRSFQYGRGVVRRGRDGAGKAVYVFGTPRYLWRMAASAWIQYVLSVFCGEEARFEAGRKLYYLRGCIYEHRLLSKEKPATNSDPASDRQTLPDSRIGVS